MASRSLSGIISEILFDLWGALWGLVAFLTSEPADYLCHWFSSMPCLTGYSGAPFLGESPVLFYWGEKPYLFSQAWVEVYVNWGEEGQDYFCELRGLFLMLVWGKVTLFFIYDFRQHLHTHMKLLGRLIFKILVNFNNPFTLKESCHKYCQSDKNHTTLGSLSR